MFNHHDTDLRDVRVHFTKRQLVQDLCFSGCLKPNPQDRHLGDLACPNTQSSLVLVSPQESTDACAAVMSRPERSSGRLSRPGVTTCLSDSSRTCCRLALGVSTFCSGVPSRNQSETDRMRVTVVNGCSARASVRGGLTSICESGCVKF